MAVEKQYMVNLRGVETKTFNMGRNRLLTIANGTIIPEGHELIKLFPSYVVEVGERILLEEAPVADAKVDEVVEDKKEEVVEEQKSPDIVEDKVEDKKEEVVEEQKEPAKRGPKPKVQE